MTMNSRNFFPVTLMRKEREYDQVFSFFFQAEEPVEFIPGQYVHFLAPASGPSRENVRHLSMASIPAEGELRFSLDLRSTSDFKRKLAALRPGERAHIFRVKGDFVLGSPPPAQVVFIAGGLGITPIRGLIRQIVHESLPVDWRLLHAAREAWLYEAELSDLRGTQLRVRREGVPEVLDSWTQQWPAARYYLCGSSRFVTGLREALASRRVNANMVTVEDFE
jgi:ferredoxin-NADP reductase